MGTKKLLSDLQAVEQQDASNGRELSLNPTVVETGATKEALGYSDIMEAFSKMTRRIREEVVAKIDKNYLTTDTLVQEYGGTRTTVQRQIEILNELLGRFPDPNNTERKRYAVTLMQGLGRSHGYFFSKEGRAMLDKMELFVGDFSSFSSALQSRLRNDVGEQVGLAESIASCFLDQENAEAALRMLKKYGLFPLTLPELYLNQFFEILEEKLPKSVLYNRAQSDLYEILLQAVAGRDQKGFTSRDALLRLLKKRQGEVLAPLKVPQDSGDGDTGEVSTALVELEAFYKRWSSGDGRRVMSSGLNELVTHGTVEELVTMLENISVLLRQNTGETEVSATQNVLEEHLNTIGASLGRRIVVEGKYNAYQQVITDCREQPQKRENHVLLSSLREAVLEQLSTMLEENRIDAPLLSFAQEVVEPVSFGVMSAAAKELGKELKHIGTFLTTHSTQEAVSFFLTMRSLLSVLFPEESIGYRMYMPSFLSTSVSVLENKLKEAVGERNKPAVLSLLSTQEQVLTRGAGKDLCRIALQDIQEEDLHHMRQEESVWSLLDRAPIQQAAEYLDRCVAQGEEVALKIRAGMDNLFVHHRTHQDWEELKKILLIETCRAKNAKGTFVPLLSQEAVGKQLYELLLQLLSGESHFSVHTLYNPLSSSLEDLFHLAFVPSYNAQDTEQPLTQVPESVSSYADWETVQLQLTKKVLDEFLQGKQSNISASSLRSMRKKDMAQLGLTSAGEGTFPLSQEMVLDYYPRLLACATERGDVKQFFAIQGLAGIGVEDVVQLEQVLATVTQPEWNLYIRRITNRIPGATKENIRLLSLLSSFEGARQAMEGELHGVVMKMIEGHYPLGPMVKQLGEEANRFVAEQVFSKSFVPEEQATIRNAILQSLDEIAGIGGSYWDKLPALMTGYRNYYPRWIEDLSPTEKDRVQQALRVFLHKGLVAGGSLEIVDHVAEWEQDFPEIIPHTEGELSPEYTALVGDAFLRTLVDSGGSIVSLLEKQYSEVLHNQAFINYVGPQLSVYMARSIERENLSVFGLKRYQAVWMLFRDYLDPTAISDGFVQFAPERLAELVMKGDLNLLLEFFAEVCGERCQSWEKGALIAASARALVWTLGQRQGVHYDPENSKVKNMVLGVSKLLGTVDQVRHTESLVISPAEVAIINTTIPARLSWEDRKETENIVKLLGTLRGEESILINEELQRLADTGVNNPHELYSFLFHCFNRKINIPEGADLQWLQETISKSTEFYRQLLNVYYASKEEIVILKRILSQCGLVLHDLQWPEDALSFDEELERCSGKGESKVELFTQIKGFPKTPQSFYRKVHEYLNEHLQGDGAKHMDDVLVLMRKGTIPKELTTLSFLVEVYKDLGTFAPEVVEPYFVLRKENPEAIPGFVKDIRGAREDFLHVRDVPMQYENMRIPLLKSIYPERNYSVFQKWNNLEDCSKVMDQYRYNKEGYPILVSGVKGHTLKDKQKKDSTFQTELYDRVHRVIRELPTHQSIADLLHDVPDLQSETLEGKIVEMILGDEDEQKKKEFAGVDILLAYQLHGRFEEFRAATSDRTLSKSTPESEEYYKLSVLSEEYGDRMKDTIHAFEKAIAASQDSQLFGGGTVQETHEKLEERFEGIWSTMLRNYSNERMDDRGRKAALGGSIKKALKGNITVFLPEGHTMESFIVQKVAGLSAIMDNPNLSEQEKKNGALEFWRQDVMGELSSKPLELKELRSLVVQQFQKVSTELDKYEEKLVSEGAKRKERRIQGYFASNKESKLGAMIGDVCIAAALDRCNNLKSFDLVLMDSDRGKCVGTVMLLVMEDQGKKHLLYCPNPSVGLCSEVSTSELHRQMLNHVITFAQENGMQSILTDTISGRGTNRTGEFYTAYTASVLKDATGKVKTKDLQKPHLLGGGYTYQKGLSVLWEGV